MKILTVVALTMASLVSGNVSGQVAQSTLTEPKITITIKTEQSIAAVGSAVEVQVEMKNISAADISYGAAGIFGAGTTSFRWEIRDGEGRAIPMTQYGLKVNHLDDPREGVAPTIRAESAFAETLRPGKSVVQKVALSKEYDLGKPGKYTIQALRFDGNVEVKSNIITLTLTR
jgi:hypothetical protein